MVLEDYFGEAILNFKTSYQYLQQKLSSNGHTLTIYWKIHIIFIILGHSSIVINVPLYATVSNVASFKI